MSAQAAHQAWWEHERSTWPNHDLSAFVEAGGIRWHVQRTGSGPPLLLVHGTGASSHSWRDLIPTLGRQHAVLAADLPGHGFTGALPAERRSIRGMSEALSALLRTLEFAPIHCVGHSAGAVILCRMALDQHIEPRDIISINGAFLPLGGPAARLFSPIARLLAGTALLPRLLARHADSHANVARMLAATGSRLDAPGVELYVRLVRNPQHIAGALGMMGGWDLNAFDRDLPRLKVPLVLMAGGNDLTVSPEQAFEVARRVANAAIITLPNLGHLAHEEEPALVAQEILKICRARAASP